MLSNFLYVNLRISARTQRIVFAPEERSVSQPGNKRRGASTKKSVRLIADDGMRIIKYRCGMDGKKCVKMVKVSRDSCDIHRGRAKECTISDEDIMKGLSKESKNELDLTRKLLL